MTDQQHRPPGNQRREGTHGQYPREQGWQQQPPGEPYGQYPPQQGWRQQPPSETYGQYPPEQGWQGQPPGEPYGQYPPQQGWQQPTQGWQQQYPAQHQHATAPRKRKRVFLWVFLAIQALFLIWIIAGLSGTQASRTQGVTAADRSQAVKMCDQGGWRYLSPSDSVSGANTNKSNADYTSEAQCVSDQAKDYAALDRAGSTAGSAIGVGIIIALWVVVDFLVGGGYAIYRLASRRRYV